MKYQNSSAMKMLRAAILFPIIVWLIGGLFANWKITLAVLALIVILVLRWAMTYNTPVHEDSSNSTSNNAPSTGPMTERYVYELRKSHGFYDGCPDLEANQLARIAQEESK